MVVDSVGRVVPDAIFLPGQHPYEVAVPAPGPGPQWWAGAPSAVVDADGSYVLTYRRRDGAGIDALVFARSTDGVRFETSAELHPGSVGAAMTERASLHRLEDGRWRMYASFATPNSNHWWVGQAEAASPEGLAEAAMATAFVGDETIGFKDPVVLRADEGWCAYLCGHPLDVVGAEDRMITHRSDSTDGWVVVGTRARVCTAERGSWDARGARLTGTIAGRLVRVRRPRHRRGELVREDRSGCAREPTAS